MSKNAKKITILWGLPGSGKTTYANTYQINNRRVKIVSLDNLRKLSKEKMLEVLVDEFSYYGYDYIIDGLITTNSLAIEIMDKIKRKYANAEFSIVYWVKDIESCLHNDKYRRSENSTITIETIPYEKPDRELLKPYVFKNNFKKMTVVRKPDSDIWIQEMGFSKFLESNTWSLGGTYGNCYDSEKSIIDPEPQPASFIEFDELILNLCPNITFMQYKNLYNKTVTINTEQDSDYYGGYSTKANYQCNLIKLYEIMLDMKLIEPVCLDQANI